MSKTSATVVAPVSTPVVDPMVVAINELQQQVSNLTARLDKAAQVTYTKDRAAVDRAGTATLAATVEKQAVQIRSLTAKINTLTTKLDAVKNGNRTNDVFFVGLDSLREQSGDPEAQFDRLEILAEGRRLLALQKQPAMPTAPATPTELDDVAF